MWFKGNKEFLEYLQSSLVPWIALLVLLSLMVLVIFWLRSRFRDDEDPAGSEHQMLLHMRDLNRQGHLTDEEYRSIKGRLTKSADGMETASKEAKGASSDETEQETKKDS